MERVQGFIGFLRVLPPDPPGDWRLPGNNTYVQRTGFPLSTGQRILSGVMEVVARGSG